MNMDKRRYFLEAKAEKSNPTIVKTLKDGEYVPTKCEAILKLGSKSFNIDTDMFVFERPLKRQ